MVCGDELVAIVRDKSRVETAYGVVDYTKRLRGRVLLKSHDLESEGMRGFAESPNLW